MAEASELSIDKRLQSMGFSIPDPTPSPLPIGPIIFMGFLIFLAFLGIWAVVPPAPQGKHYFPFLIIAGLIAITKTIAVLAAILPKLCFSNFRPDSRGQMPYMAWLASTLLAAIIALLLERAALVIADQASISDALNFKTYPPTLLAPTTAAICLAIAFLCDVDLGLGYGWLRRITEG